MFLPLNKLSEDEVAGKAPSYYEESESEYESEEDEASEDKMGGWTKTPVVDVKEFDPRTDKMLDIVSNEDFLMDSLKNFKPPNE